MLLVPVHAVFVEHEAAGDMQDRLLVERRGRHRYG